MELNIIGASPERRSCSVSLTDGVPLYMPIMESQCVYIPFVCVTQINAKIPTYGNDIYPKMQCFMFMFMSFIILF